MSKQSEPLATAELSEHLRPVIEDILTNEKSLLEILEEAKNIRMPEHKQVYPKSIKRED